MAEVGRAAVEAVVAGLDRDAVVGARWFGAKGRAITSVELAEAFILSDTPLHVLAAVDIGFGRGRPDRYVFVVTGDGGSLRIGEPGDGSWRALAAAIAEGRTIAALPRAPSPAAAPGVPGPVTAALVCRPASSLRDLVAGRSAGVAALDERPLGSDQSNTSVVLGERLLLKAFRRLQPGLNPDLELIAYLSEEARFPAVPPLGGYAELVSRSGPPATVAMLQGFVAGAADAYEHVAETLAAWIRAPGAVSVEFATEIAADVGALTAALHSSLAAARGVPDFDPRPATRAELRGWHDDARAQLDLALEVTTGPAAAVLRELAPRIVEELTLFEALASEPTVTRVHGDLHLGQVLVAPDGFRIIDFEGEPTRTLEERRAHRSPLRDAASMLRSIDHAGRSARRRAEVRNEGPVATPGLDIDAWLVRARDRFLAAYSAGLRHGGRPIDVDPALLRAFEIEKECYEFVYAATYLPDWLWAPTEGLRGLFDTGPTA